MHVQFTWELNRYDQVIDFLNTLFSFLELHYSKLTFVKV